MNVCVCVCASDHDVYCWCFREESALFQMAQDMHIEDDHRNDDSLMAEMNLVAMPTSVPGLDHILSENERLHTEK